LPPVSDGNGLMSQMDAKLRALCDELSQHREELGSACKSQFLQQQPLMAAQTDRLPLVHGINDREGLPDLQNILVQSVLRSAAERDPACSPKQIEELLGLTDCVYTSAGVLYPQKNVALLFRATVERVSVPEASPWDSGVFGKRYRLKDLPEDQRIRYRALFRSHCLPAPQYRTYFCYYIATHFGNINQYLTGQKSSFPDRLDLLKDTSFGARMFEVRFPQRLPISASTLMAVFVRDKAGNAQWIQIKRRLLELEKAGVYVDYYDHRANINKRVQDYIRAALQGAA